LREIHSQPEVRGRCLDTLDKLDLDLLAGDKNPLTHKWLFVGCGTSYYLAKAAAATFTALTGAPAESVTPRIRSAPATVSMPDSWRHTCAARRQTPVRPSETVPPLSPPCAREERSLSAILHWWETFFPEPSETEKAVYALQRGLFDFGPTARCQHLK